MINIFNQLDYNDDYSVEKWNQLTKDIFLKYFTSEDIYLRNKEILRSELVNYMTIYYNNHYIKLLNDIHLIFSDSIQKNQKESFELLLNNFEKVSNTDDRYLSYFISQPDVTDFTKKDFAVYYFKSIDEIIEGCYNPRFKLFYQFYKFNKNNIFEDIKNKSLGNLVTDKEFENFDLLIKDPIFNIHINQWRNIASHKDYKVSKNNIEIRYGTKKDKIKTITHDELKKITFWIRDIYASLRLAEVLIHLNYMEDIMSLDEFKNINIEQRSEATLLHIIHNLQIVGFKFESFYENNTTFELNLFIKNNNDIKESIIHSSQMFSPLACALNDDEFQKDKFTDIKINILNDKKETLASATVDIKSCLDFSNHKLSQKELIYKINFCIT
ncbi:MAG: hypothetical protein U9R39_10110 [Campylobacterota bacterium]|nr:hypothetical protein [Campylobacterota bacterium]